MSARLVYAAAVPGVGRVRVSYRADLAEFCARLAGPDGHLVAEYFTDDRADAVATADRLLVDQARALGLE